MVTILHRGFSSLDRAALPEDEYYVRRVALQEHLLEADLKGLFVFSDPDDYADAAYLGGTLDGATVYLPAVGDPILLGGPHAWREQRVLRARRGSATSACRVRFHRPRRRCGRSSMSTHLSGTESASAASYGPRALPRSRPPARHSATASSSASMISCAVNGVRLDHGSSSSCGQRWASHELRQPPASAHTPQAPPMPRRRSRPSWQLVPIARET